MESQDKTMLTSDKTMIATAAGPDATILGTTITCPICKTENAPNEKYCGECGFLLSSTPVEEVAAPDTSQMPRLADSGGREYLLKDGENSVGREATDVLLTDPTVSRRHATLTLDGATAWVEDLGSSNGTYAAGARVQSGDKVEVADGAELKFGSATLTLILPVQSETAEAPAESATEAVGQVTDVEEPEVESPAEPSAEAEEVQAEAPTGPAPVALLVSADPPGEFPLAAGTNTIGRRAGNDIVLDGDAYVSGAHAEIVADERGFWLTDVGSTNGTTLNGSTIAPNAKMALNPGDEIVFGRTALKLDVPAEEPAEETHGSAD